MVSIANMTVLEELYLMPQFAGNKRKNMLSIYVSVTGMALFMHQHSVSLIIRDLLKSQFCNFCGNCKK